MGKASPQAKFRAAKQREVEARHGQPIRDLLHDLYEVRGWGNRAIGKHLGIGSTTILSWLRDAGIPVRPPEPPITPTLFCRQCGGPLSAAQHRAKRHDDERGVYCSRDCSALGRSKQLPASEILALYAGGVTLLELAERYRTTVDTLRKIFVAAGVPIRRQFPRAWAGKNLPEATKAKLRAATNRQFADPENRRRAGERTAKQIQEGRTGKAFNRLETTVAAMLDEVGAEYVWQHRLGHYVFDFYLPAINTLVECHGTFWHADPRAYDRTDLGPTQRRNVANDARKEAFALAGGYGLMALWERDIRADPAGTRSRLAALLDVAAD